VDALRQDEEQGKRALESLVDLSHAQAQLWKDHANFLVKIVADIMRTKEFEQGTRSQATEVVLNLSEQMPATMRKINEMKTEFFPAVVQLIAECEEDMEAWAQEDEQATESNAH